MPREAEVADHRPGSTMAGLALPNLPLFLPPAEANLLQGLTLHCLCLSRVLKSRRDEASPCLRGAQISAAQG